MNRPTEQQHQEAAELDQTEGDATKARQLLQKAMAESVSLARERNHWREQWGVAVEQRDNLLAALEAISLMRDSVKRVGEGTTAWGVRDAADVADAAIAEAKGEA